MKGMNFGVEWTGRSDGMNEVGDFRRSIEAMSSGDECW